MVAVKAFSHADTCLYSNPDAVCTALLRSPGSPPRGPGALATGVSPRVLEQLSGGDPRVPSRAVAWAAPGVLTHGEAGV